jgi:hypothetical protein
MKCGKLSTTKSDDVQIGGEHYRSKSIQQWEAMEAWFTPREFIGYLRGNVIKYIGRYPDKNGIEDLRKAKHYLDKLIEMETKYGDQ